MSDFRDLIVRRRSVRRFKESEALSEETLREFVDLARICSSAMNRQPLRYVLSVTPERNAIIFSHLSWAGDLPDWDGPGPGERPTAYILVLADNEVGGTPEYDAGIAVQTIMLAAAERGLGGCIMGSVDGEALAPELEMPKRYTILLALALGVPAEKVVLEDAAPDGNLRYWRDTEDVHHVPKLKLDDVIVG